MDGPGPEAKIAVAISGVTFDYGDAAVLHDINLNISSGEIISLLGPSGCGKTTLLRCIAGLEKPSEGSITINGVVVSQRGVWVKPGRRGLGMVFQDGALFPHLTVEQNISFGLGGGDHADRIDYLLALIGLPDTNHRLPSTLSGGQQQRVALARALAPAPSVLLLDEPFSSLDATLRVQIRQEVLRILREVNVTAIFVTHDQEEAFEIGDRVAVLRDGYLEQVAGTQELYRRPVTPWVASFVGEANLLNAEAFGDVAATALGPVSLAQPMNGPVTVLVRPEDLIVRDYITDETAQVTVAAIRYRGHDTLLDTLAPDGAQVLVRLQGDPPTETEIGLTFVGAPAASWPRAY